jgi:hypothetical protein
MDLLHHPALLDTVRLPRLRIARNGIRQKLQFLSSRLAAKPAARLVLIGPPGTGKITLSRQIILIEVTEPESQPDRALQSVLNFISKSTRLAVQNLKLWTGASQIRKSLSANIEPSTLGLNEIDLSVAAPIHEPYLPGLEASADLWNFVTADKGFVEI